MWAACHSPSSFESFGGLITDVNMNYLSSTGLIPWGSHAGGTPPYQYNELSPNAADDPLMQIMNRFDLAMTNGSEQIFIPQTTWRPTTTVAVYDPAGTGQRPNPSSPQVAPAAVVYGNAGGDPDAGIVMYQAGHTHLKGPALDQIAAQRAYFNFILYNGVLRAPKIDVTLPNDRGGPDHDADGRHQRRVGVRNVPVDQLQRQHVLAADRHLDGGRADRDRLFADRAQRHGQAAGHRRLRTAQRVRRGRLGHAAVLGPDYSAASRGWGSGTGRQQCGHPGRRNGDRVVGDPADQPPGRRRPSNW
jgi:hypothetical protein